MANVLSAGATTDLHYKHSGFSNTITDSYSSPSNSPTGITWDGTNAISADLNTDLHYKHSGFSSTITDTYSSPNWDPIGIAWDSTNVISVTSTLAVTKHYKHSGFSNTITDSYSSPSNSPTGITWDGTNAISADLNTDLHYKHSGFSSTITDTYSSPGSFPYGIEWDGTHVISVDSSTEKHYKHSGFSSTITDSYSNSSTGATGIAWDEAAGATYNAEISLTQNLTIVPAKIPLSTTYTTIPIVRKRLKNIDTDISDTDIEQYIWEAEGIIDATMKDSFLTIFDASKHDLIRACATDLAALQIITYDPTVHPTIEAAAMTADLLLASTKDALAMLSNPRNVKYWKSL